MNPGGRNTRWVAIAVGAALLSPAFIAGAASGAGKAAAKTIKIGYVNDEGAAFSLPEFRIGGEVAIDYINKHGGIKGVKIQEVKCLADASPEASIN